MGPKAQWKPGGRVLIATRDHIKAVLHDTPQNESKFIFVNLLFSYNCKITLGVFYRPPSNDPKPLEDLQAVLQELSLNELILLGDFNLPEIDWLNNRALRQSDIYMLMMDVVQDNFLTQLVNEPTRESNILAAILITIGLTGKICYSQRSTNVFPNAGIEGDLTLYGLPSNLLFCARGRNYCTTERAELTKLLFGKNIANSTTVLRDFVTQLGGCI